MEATGKPQRTAVRLLNQFTLDPIHSAKLDLSDLQRGDRRLAITGYTVCVIIFLLTFVIEIFGGSLETVRYQSVSAERDISLFVAFIALLVYPLAWALILLGAARASRKVFYPILAIYIALIVFAAYLGNDIIGGCLIPFSAAFLIAFQWFGKRKGWFERRPIAIYLLFVVIILFQNNVGGEDELPVMLSQLDLFLRLINYIGWPVWILSGLALITFSASLTSELMQGLPRLFSGPGFLRFAMLTLCIQLLLSVVLNVATTLLSSDQPIIRGFLNIGVISGALFVLFMFAAMALKRWNTQFAAILLASSFFIFILRYGIAFLLESGTNISDPLGILNAQIQIFPSGTFFMFNLVLGILGFFVPFANGDSPGFPRPARIGVALGFALLLISMMFFFLLARDITTGENYANDSIFTLLFTIGAMYIGLPYAIFMLARRHEAFLGPLQAWQNMNETPTKNAYSSLRVWLLLLIPVWAALLRLLMWLFQGSA